MRYFAPVLMLALLVGCGTLQAAAGAPGSGAEPAQPQSSGAAPGAGDAVFYTGLDSPQPKCPEVADLVPTDPADESRLLAIAPGMIKALYTQPGYEEYTNLSVALAAQAGLHGEMVKTWCGAKVAESTWVVKLTFPKKAPSASMSAGQFMVSKTRKGWNVWFRYH